MLELTQAQIGEIRLLCEKYGVDRARVFGSRISGKSSPDSDVDLLVRFIAFPSLYTLIRFQHELSDQIGLRFDVVTEDSIPTQLWSQIDKEAIAV